MAGKLYVSAAESETPIDGVSVVVWRILEDFHIWKQYGSARVPIERCEHFSVAKIIKLWREVKEAKWVVADAKTMKN